MKNRAQEVSDAAKGKYNELKGDAKVRAPALRSSLAVPAVCLAAWAAGCAAAYSPVLPLRQRAAPACPQEAKGEIRARAEEAEDFFKQ